MAILFALYDKITSLLSLFQLRIAYTGQLIEFNVNKDALKSSSKIHAFYTRFLKAYPFKNS
jgi:hypothetical protein